MSFAALLFALTTIVTNPRVAVTDGEDQGAREHDSVVVDLAGASARFVAHGTPLATRGRSIIVELLGAPVGAKENKSGFPDAFDRPGIEKLLENDKVIVWRYTWQPGKKTPMHFHARDVVAVSVADGELASITPDGKTTTTAFSFGGARFNPGGRIHQEELVKGKATAVIVELK